MKYIIFKKDGAVETPVLFPNFVEHSTVKINGCSEISSGELVMETFTVIPKVHIRKKRDEKLLKCLFNDSTKSLFFNENYI